MKTSTNILSRLRFVVAASVLIASTLLNAQDVKTMSGRESSGEMARLIVNRTANFGLNETVVLFVDGTKVAALGYSDSYNAPLAPGKHVLFIKTSPETYPEGAPKRIAITAEPGKSYAFTAVWLETERAGLIEG
jgi:hypothetical protein